MTKSAQKPQVDKDMAAHAKATAVGMDTYNHALTVQKQAFKSLYGEITPANEDVWNWFSVETVQVFLKTIVTKDKRK